MLFPCSQYCIATTYCNDKSNFLCGINLDWQTAVITGDFLFCHIPLCITLKVSPQRNLTWAHSEAETSVYIPSNMLSRQNNPPEAMHMIGACEIRLTVNFLLCLLWEILLPNVWQECRTENHRHSGKAASPGIWPLCASELLQVLSISSDCSTCQSAYSKASPFPRKSSFSLPLGPVSKCHFSLDFTASLQPCTKAPVEGVLSAVVDLLSN